VLMSDVVKLADDVTAKYCKTDKGQGCNWGALWENCTFVLRDWAKRQSFPLPCISRLSWMLHRTRRTLES